VKFKSRAVSRFVGEAQQQQQRFANQQSEVSAREQKVGLILRAHSQITSLAAQRDTCWLRSPLLMLLLQMFALKYKQAFHACACVLHTNCASEPHKGKIINGARRSLAICFFAARALKLGQENFKPNKDACVRVHIVYIRSG
jgi:hypothetical protein